MYLILKLKAYLTCFGRLDTIYSDMAYACMYLNMNEGKDPFIII